MHRPRILSDFFKNPIVDILLWPGNSSNLKPIENLQNILKDIVAKKQPPFAKQLVDVIRQFEPLK